MQLSKLSMFLPPHFKVTDQQTIVDFIGSNPFATISTYLEDDLQANHLPVQVSEDDAGTLKLFGHFARNNPLVTKLKEPAPCLSVFHGADCYISPNWYETKKQTCKAVPTWDYQTVHVRGTIKLIDDEQWLFAFLNRLTDEHEAEQSAPWKVSDAPESYISDMIKAIIGIEIEVFEASMKSKLNQNHPIENQIGIVEGIKIASNATEKQSQIASQISKNLDQMF